MNELESNSEYGKLPSFKLPSFKETMALSPLHKAMWRWWNPSREIEVQTEITEWDATVPESGTIAII